MPVNRPRVVHVVVGANPGGADTFIVNLASRVEQSGAEHFIALMTANPDLRDIYKSSGLAVYDRGLVREPFLWHFRRLFGPEDLSWLLGIISQVSATIVHAHLFGSHVLSARAGRRAAIPVIRTEHGLGHHRDWTRTHYRHWALLNTDRIVAVCEDVARHVRALEPRVASRVKVILNGIDPIGFPLSPPVEDVPLTIGWTARLDPEKQAELAIEAVARVPGVRLNLAGEGSERNKLETLVRKLGVEDRVKFLGFQRDVRPVVAASHVVINCRREDAMPFSLIEAAFMGRPAIAFNGGGIPEVVRDRETGLLAKTCSAEAFAELIAVANRDRPMLLKLGANARKLAEERFTLDSMCRQYGALYSALADGSGEIPQRSLSERQYGAPIA